LGAKTATVAKLRGLFCSFFLRGPKFEKVRGLKLQLSLKNNREKNKERE